MSYSSTSSACPPPPVPLIPSVRITSQSWSDTYEFTIKIQLPGMEVHKCRPWPIRGPRKIITRQSINIFNSSSILMTNSAAVDRFLPTTWERTAWSSALLSQRAMSQSSITPASQPGLGTWTRDGLWIVSCCRFLSIKQMFNKYGGVRSWRKNQSPSDVRLPIDPSNHRLRIFCVILSNATKHGYFDLFHLN